MVDANTSGCINHPAVEAVARCKQCNKPVCSSCVIQGQTGVFCSDGCRDRHHAFINRAQELDSMRKPGKNFVDIAKRYLVKAVILIILILSVGFVATYFGIHIPILSDICNKFIG